MDQYIADSDTNEESTERCETHTKEKNIGKLKITDPLQDPGTDGIIIEQCI
jgi:hypothetical protein